MANRAYPMARVRFPGVQFPMAQEQAPVACPVCGGLQCLCRPRFFAGQLLTEEDLNHLERYIIEKNKLHNRYLHGPGVVCGLQVVCHECEGWVTVQQGYAIDPCGNDVIVCEDYPFNVIQAIRECRQVQRRDECEPLGMPVDETCEEMEEHWCITIAYEEREARPIGALRQERADGLSCCHSEKKENCQSTVRVRGGGGSTIAPCEPTRIIEGYRLGVFRAPADHCNDLKRALEEMLSSEKWDPAVLIPPDSLLARIVRCADHINAFLSARIPPEKMRLIAGLNSTENIGEFVEKHPNVDLHDLCCVFYRAVKELYLQNPYSVRCTAAATFGDEIRCPPPPTADENLLEYAQQVQVTVRQLFGMLLQYGLDCVCQALLPPCPPDPGDERLVLACVTIKNDRITHICNFACRQYAGAFPSVSYWLSLVPVFPILGDLIQWICCDPESVQFAGLLQVFTHLTQLVRSMPEHVIPGYREWFGSRSGTG